MAHNWLSSVPSTGVLLRNSGDSAEIPSEIEGKCSRASSGCEWFSVGSCRNEMLISPSAGGEWPSAQGCGCGRETTGASVRGRLSYCVGQAAR